MIHSELLQRALNVAELANGSRITDADVKEVSEVYFLLTGKKVACKRCEVYRLITEIDRTINPKPKAMAIGKYQFKQAGQEVVRNTGNGFRKITAENLNTGDNVEYLMKRHAHLIEENPQFKAEKPAAKVVTPRREELPVKAAKKGRKSHKK